jgi:hypothetical protein
MIWGPEATWPTHDGIGASCRGFSGACRGVGSATRIEQTRVERARGANRRVEATALRTPQLPVRKTAFAHIHAAYQRRTCKYKHLALSDFPLSRIVVESCPLITYAANHQSHRNSMMDGLSVLLRDFLG